jgi:hypothetical protein
MSILCILDFYAGNSTVKNILVNFIRDMSEAMDEWKKGGTAQEVLEMFL